MKKNIIIIIILLLTALLRSYKISAPIADWHSWRQVDTAAVARNFERFGIDILKPRYDDLSNIQTGKDNPEGLRLVEMPLYQAAATIVSTVTKINIEISLRILSILASVITCFSLVYIISILIDNPTGLLSGFIYAILPYNIYYGRTILPDVPMTAFALASVASLVCHYRNAKSKPWPFSFWFWLSTILASLSILMKPMAVFLLIPNAYLIFRNDKISPRTLVAICSYAFVALFPIWWWRSWINQFSEGIPVSGWLFNSGDIRFKGAWFYWLFADRIGRLILGYWGVMFLVLGFAAPKAKKEGYITYLWACGILLYFSIIARGNVQHDYYQILTIPVLTIFLAKGIIFFLNLGKYNRFTNWILFIITFIFMEAFSWYSIRTYYWINHPEIIEAGNKVKEIATKDAKVIAPYSGDTTFLYQTGHQGWPIGFDIQDKINKGAKYYVSVAEFAKDGEIQDLASKYIVLVRTDKYIIIDLSKKK
jgi:hypothetical protein